MQIEEKMIREEVSDDKRSFGCVTVRYPSFGGKYRRIDSFYLRVAGAFLAYAKKKIPSLAEKDEQICTYSAVMFCRTTFNSDTIFSSICESRLYRGNDCLYRRRFSTAWELETQTLKYIRHFGMRRSNVSYDGRELTLFDG